MTLKVSWEKITVDMLDRHAAWLDMIRVMIRVRHRRAASRAELIRALIDSMERSGVDFTRFSSVEDIVAFLTSHFRKVRG